MCHVAPRKQSPTYRTTGVAPVPQERGHFHATLTSAFYWQPLGISPSHDEHLLAGADEEAIQALGVSQPVLARFQQDVAICAPTLFTRPSSASAVCDSSRRSRRLVSCAGRRRSD